MFQDKHWINSIYNELKEMQLQPEKRLRNVISRYYLYFTVPVCELFKEILARKILFELKHIQIYLVLHARFLDDVLDNDNNGVGYETNLLLSHYTLNKAYCLLQKSEIFSGYQGEFWNNMRQSYEFHTKLTKSFQNVNIATYLKFHWKRGAQFFFLPEIIIKRFVPETQAQDFRQLLKYYFDVAICQTDIKTDHLLSDYRNRLNTPAILFISDHKKKIRTFTELEQNYNKWLIRKIIRALRIAEKYDLSSFRNLLRNFYKQLE